MSVYITSAEIKHELIRAEFTTQSRDPNLPTPIFDQDGFDTMIEEYLLMADSTFISIINKKNLLVADIPVYGGLSQCIMDLLEYYVYYRFFERKFITATTKDTADSKKQNADYFKKEYNAILIDLSVYDITNNAETDPKNNDRNGSRGEWQ